MQQPNKGEITMSKKPIVGIMGPGNSANTEQKAAAHQLGRLVAKNGYHLLSGGGPGTMESACRGAKEAGGLVIAIASGDDSERLNQYVDIPIITNMGGGRNYMNILSCDRIIAIGSDSAGTLSEIAFALNSTKPLLIFGAQPDLCSTLPRFRPKENPPIMTDNYSTVEEFLS